MGRLILILLAALAVFVVVSVVIHALTFLFWVAVIALVIVGLMRLSGSLRQRRR